MHYPIFDGCDHSQWNEQVCSQHLCKEDGKWPYHEMALQGKKITNRLQPATEWWRGVLNSARRLENQAYDSSTRRHDGGGVSWGFRVLPNPGGIRRNLYSGAASAAAGGHESGTDVLHYDVFLWLRCREFGRRLVVLAADTRRPRWLSVAVGNADDDQNAACAFGVSTTSADRGSGVQNAGISLRA